MANPGRRRAGNRRKRDAPNGRNGAFAGGGRKTHGGGCGQRNRGGGMVLADGRGAAGNASASRCRRWQRQRRRRLTAGRENPGELGAAAAQHPRALDHQIPQQLTTNHKRNNPLNNRTTWRNQTSRGQRRM